jgi:hypothetical protein
MYGGQTTVEDKRLFLCLRTLPARITGIEAGWLLGFNREEITLITSAGHLKPLGKPALNGQKYYATAQLQKLAADPTWLDKATRIISESWRKKNAKQNESSNAVS